MSPLTRFMPAFTFVSLFHRLSLIRLQEPGPVCRGAGYFRRYWNTQSDGNAALLFIFLSEHPQQISSAVVYIYMLITSPSSDSHKSHHLLPRAGIWRSTSWQTIRSHPFPLGRSVSYSFDRNIMFVGFLRGRIFSESPGAHIVQSLERCAGMLRVWGSNPTPMCVCGLWNFGNTDFFWIAIFNFLVQKALIPNWPRF